ncbi:MAG: beta-propeller fold lactonase family protein [Spirochaetes bacterium]|nr:beta-propeller fold lactonase family protein [Spirochaetota bacterium]
MAQLKYKDNEVIKNLYIFFIIFFILLTCSQTDDPLNSGKPRPIPEYFATKIQYSINDFGLDPVTYNLRDAVMSSDENFIYVSVYGLGIVKLQRNTTTGFLSYVGYCDLVTPTATDGFDKIKLSPDNEYLYITCRLYAGQNLIAWVSLDNLTYVSNILSSSSSSRDICISSDGNSFYFLFSNSIYQYDINKTTGVLSNSKTYSPGGSFTSMNISPDGNYLYFIDAWPGGDTVKWYTRDPGTGDLYFLKSLRETDKLNSYINYGDNLLVSNDNNFVYLTETAGNPYYILCLNKAANGDLTFFCKMFPYSSIIFGIGLSSDGNNIYTDEQDSISWYSRDNSTESFSFKKNNTLEDTLTACQIITSQDGSHIYYFYGESIVFVKYIDWPD